MRRINLAGLLAAALLACGGSNSDSLSACKAAIESLCTKTFDCFPTEAQQFYGSLSNCITNRQATVCTTANTTCPQGTHFNSDNANRCVEDYKNESCTDLGNGITPASCSAGTCTP